ncbi:uncharacterized protein LOC135142191 [Zophobas morio]|uniref:uncharacterized protein LOC135142191 n=1 Tax=Zophobas morio TaxID=2755281 RepID=UPI00308359F5
MPTREKIEEIINQMRINKSPGSNEIAKESPKYGSEKLKDDIQLKKLRKLPWQCFIRRYVQTVASIIKRRPEGYMEEALGEYQGGFREGRGRIDQIFVLKQIIVGNYEMKFLLIYSSWTSKKITIRVTVKGKTSDSFNVKQGLRQGDPLSTTLFNLVLEGIIRKSDINRKGLLFNRSHQCLAYADDLILLVTNRKELERIIAKLMRQAEEVDLWSNCGSRNKNNLQMDRQKGIKVEFEEVEILMYLGVLITNKCQEDKEIELRVAKSNNCAGGLRKIMKSKEKSRLEIWERKILRKILGGKQTENRWERRTNVEIYDLYNDKVVSNFIKIKRLQWLGHLERITQERKVKMVVWKIPESKRKRVRPREKWKDAIQEDLTEKQKQDWRKNAKKLKEWRLISKLCLREV